MFLFRKKNTFREYLKSLVGEKVTYVYRDKSRNGKIKAVEDDFLLFVEEEEEHIHSCPGIVGTKLVLVKTRTLCIPIRDIRHIYRVANVYTLEDTGEIKKTGYELYIFS